MVPFHQRRWHLEGGLALVWRRCIEKQRHSHSRSYFGGQCERVCVCFCVYAGGVWWGVVG